jgi:hypothetical protein
MGFLLREGGSCNSVEGGAPLGNLADSFRKSRKTPRYYWRTPSAEICVSGVRCMCDPHMQELKIWSSFIHLPHRHTSDRMSVLSECLPYPFKNLLRNTPPLGNVFTFSLSVCVNGSILAGTIAILSSRALRSACGGFVNRYRYDLLYRYLMLNWCPA